MAKIKPIHEHDPIELKIDENSDKIKTINNGRVVEKGFLLGENQDIYHRYWFFKLESRYDDKTGKITQAYYASYVVGAQWVDVKNKNQNKTQPLVIRPKKSVENIDFIKIFMACLNDGMASEDFSKIYGIDFGGERIETDMGQTVLDPMLLCHFLSLVERIAKQSLKKGYIYHNENLKKCRGRIDIYHNERKNVLLGRSDRVYCKYSEYGINIPENKIIKKALLISRNIYSKLSVSNKQSLLPILSRCLAAFDGVNDDIQPNDIKAYKENKLFKEYSEAIRLARIILNRSGYSISESNINQNKVLPFWINMSALFEYYCLYLLRREFGDNIIYQYDDLANKYDFNWRPDFLFSDGENSVILDAKYVPSLNEDKNLGDYVRQLSGYSRIDKIREKIKVDDDRNIPCVLIYPLDDDNSLLDFSHLKFSEDGLKKYEIQGLHKFYKIPIKFPKIK